MWPVSKRGQEVAIFRQTEETQILEISIFAVNSRKMGDLQSQILYFYKKILYFWKIILRQAKI